MLYLERHELHLRTFPEGNIRHKTTSHKDARKRIEQAIESDKFLGTFNHDNFNPKRADKKFKDFITAMEKHCSIKLPVRKFFNEEVWDENEKLTFGNPAGLAILKKGDVLIVVDYCFTMPDNTEGETGLNRIFNMPISPDTIKFHLFEMIEVDV
ncbi:MAG: hypothetical protein JKY25_09260 [Robiginitomaculum sp.]|nr:hypothetical protein [Robiginitomaculum sp.]